MEKVDDAILVDIGGTNIRISVLNDSSKSPLLVLKTPKQQKRVLDTLGGAINEIVKMKELKIKMIAISCPGLINKNRIVQKALYVPLGGVNLAQEIELRTGLKTLVINDAKVQAMGCYNKKALLYMNIGTAIGGAYVFEKKLFLGADGYACEFGHIFIGTNIKCACGRIGCLDTVASGKCFVDEFGEGWWKRATDIGIEKKIEAAGCAVGNALAQACIMFNPKEICVAGNICNFDIFQYSVKQEFEENSWYDIPIIFKNNSWENTYCGLKKIIKECVV